MKNRKLVFYYNMAKSQKTQRWAKEANHTGAYSVWFHLHLVQEQAKAIYGRQAGRAIFSGQVIDWKGTQEAFSGVDMSAEQKCTILGYGMMNFCILKHPGNHQIRTADIVKETNNPIKKVAKGLE